MKRKFMAFMHLFIGIGALFGGFAAISNPNEPMGISTEVLAGSPFDNFLIPGLFLFCLIGMGNILAGILNWRGSNWVGYYSGFFGGSLMAWILVQCWIMGDIVFLHLLYFVLGLMQAILGLLVLVNNRQFPFMNFG